MDKRGQDVDRLFALMDRIRGRHLGYMRRHSRPHVVVDWVTNCIEVSSRDLAIR